MRLALAIERMARELDLDTEQQERLRAIVERTARAAARRALTAARGLRDHSARIHSEMSFSATGDIVCSICEYSAGEPVSHSWNRWFRRGRMTSS